jgi:hypothetical protein
MPRVCARPRCGRELLSKDGSPNYQRKFCSPEHLAEDKAERVDAKREKGRKRGSCPTCGKPWTKKAREPITGQFVSGQRRDPSKLDSNEISPSVKLHRWAENDVPRLLRTAQPSPDMGGRFGLRAHAHFPWLCGAKRLATQSIIEKGMKAKRRAIGNLSFVRESFRGPLFRFQLCEGTWRERRINSAARSDLLASALNPSASEEAVPHARLRPAAPARIRGRLGISRLPKALRNIERSRAQSGNLRTWSYREKSRRQKKSCSHSGRNSSPARRPSIKNSAKPITQARGMSPE